MKKIYLFDICGTLYNSNTTFDFLSYLLGEKKTYCLFDRFRSFWIWRGFNRLSRKILHKDITRMLALRYLKGYTREELLHAANAFYHEILIPKQNDSIIANLKSFLLNPENEVIIVSATIDVIAEIISQHLLCKKWYSSQLLFENGVCKGKLESDLLGEKLYKVFGNFYPIFESVYTDDISDLALLELAKNKNIIIYSKTVNRWKQIVRQKQWNVNFIEY